MNKSNILDELGERAISADDLAQKARRDVHLLSEIFKGISSTNPRVKYGCAKILRTLSEEVPEKLYSKMDFFIELLDSDEKILTWNAMDILANLAKVDTEEKFDNIFRKYYGFLSDEVMITVAHVVDNSGKIARAKPNLTQRITDELLRIEKIPLKPHLTQECKNILMGKTIVAFGKYFDQIENKDDVISFVKRQLHNRRNATKLKAKKFLRNLV